MQLVSVLGVIVLCVATAPVYADDMATERMLREQIFNREFEGFERYVVTIEADQPQGDGSREVMAVASGKFSGQIKRLKVLFLLIGEQVVAGQILEQTDLPPCASSSPSSSL